MASHTDLNAQIDNLSQKIKEKVARIEYILL